jgi:hypothetical protein
VKIAERNGPYDKATEELRRRFTAEACLLIVVDGSEGTGFCASAPEDLKPHLPALFRSIAHELETLIAAERNAIICPACRGAIVFDPRHPLNPDNKPKPGALTVCAGCASFLKLDGEWRLLTEEELADMNDETRNRLISNRRMIEQRRHN